MNIKRILKVTIILSLSLFFLFLSLTQANSKDLVASLAQLPGLADTPNKGAFVELVKAIDEAYTEGSIKIELYPMARSINNIIEGKKDFHIPNLRSSVIKDESALPYRIVSERMGVVTLVIYSNVDNKITRRMLDQAVSKGGTFPYKIEAGGGMENLYPFPISASQSLEQTLQKVSSKRIDALIWAQEEPDMVLKKMKLGNIYRSIYENMDDIIIAPKNARGEEVDKILSNVIRKLKRSGKLKELYSKIHVPYNNWQPSRMGW
jgi:polar amino acid transport system substrate-binding protein